MAAALLGTGISIRDLRSAHAGVVCHDVLAGKSSAGAHVSAGADLDDVEILFFSSDATPMTDGTRGRSRWRFCAKSTAGPTAGT